ncbi:MAG: phosphoesterase [Solirubrobacterales bacterium]|nr:phosphoesterase [Solirubrobacterales bacterium]
MADRKDDHVPDPAGRATCTECGNPLAPDQRYCLNCGARRGRLPGAVASTLGALGAKGKGIAAAAGAKGSKPKGDGDGEKGGWSWMPSPPAIAIAVIGMLALGVGLGSAMSEVASSAPISTLILEYPHHAAAPAPEEPKEEVEEAPEEEAFAEAPEEPAPEVFEEALPEEVVPSLPEEAIEEPQAEGEEPNPLKESIEATEREQKEREEEEAAEKLPEIKHAFLIVLGENSYESTYGTTAEAPYLSRVLPGKGELLPNYYGVTGGVLANEIALLSGQGPTAETTANCPNYTAITPGTVSETAERVEGTGCVYGKEVKSLPTQLEEKGLTWRAYVEDMENGGAIGQPFRCRKPTLGGPDGATPGPGDQYANWRNPVVYFSAIAEGEECEKHDVGYELLTHDLQFKKATPALSLIFPNACHSGGELECEPGAPEGAQGITEELKTLVPAIMSSPAYEEGGMILITSAQAPQAGDNADPSGCCLAPSYPNLVAAGIQPAAAPPTSTTETSTSPTSTTEAATELEAEAEPAKYTEESVLETGGGGKVGLLMISPYVEAGKVEEFEYANHFTLLKSLEKMFGVEPLGYATEEAVPILSPSLFRSAEEVETEAAEKKAKSAKR